MFTGAAPIFVVRDVESSRTYYRDVLGFTVTYEFGTPTYYVCLCRDQAGLHLIGARQTKRLPGQGSVAIFADEVDALYASFLAHGAEIPAPPRDYAYGMRDFNVIDPDGNQLTFGMSTGETV